MEAVYQDYREQGVQFFFVYKKLAHPDTHDDVLEPTTLAERLEHAHRANARLGTSIPWLVDSMSNDLCMALGEHANSEFIISDTGIILRMREWSNPEKLREDLADFVGPVEAPTLPDQTGALPYDGSVVAP